MVSGRMFRSIIVCVAFTTLNAAGSKVDADKERIKGITLRASLFDFPPFYTIKRHAQGNVSAEVGGLSFDMMELITFVYGVTWQFVPVDSAGWKRNNNDAIIYQLVNDEVDMAFYPFACNRLYFRLIDISFTISVIEYTLLQPWPLEESRLTAPVRPFSGVTWLFILVSIVLVVSAMALISFVQSKWETNKKTARSLQSLTGHFYSWMQYATSIVTYQGYHLTYKPESLVRIVAGIWALMMVVLLNAYTGTLTSYLTVPKLEPIINSFEQLVTQTKLKLCLGKSEMSDKFLTATTGVDKIIGDYLRENPELLVTSDYYFKPKEFVTRRIAVFFMSQDFIQYMILKDLKSTSKCRMTMSTESMNYVVQYGLPLQKDGPYKNILNDVLLKMWDFGIRNHLVNTYFPNADRCVFKIKTRGEVKSLRLYELSGIFALLGIGIGISLTAFFIEIVTHRFSSRRRET